MKILILVSTLDLTKPFAATPWILQLFKALYEEGHELLIIPYSGRSIPSLWWRSFDNPNYYKGEILEKFLRGKSNKRNKNDSSIIPALARIFAKPKIEKLVDKILQEEKNVDAMLMIGLPINQLNGLATKIKKANKIPVICYDMDFPFFATTFNYFKDANLTEYDSFITPSEGAVPKLQELGISNVDVVHFGVDPEIFTPIQIEKDIDLLFFGNGGEFRKKNLKMMITEPSRILKYNFVVSGRGLDLDLGKAKVMQPFSFTQWRNFSCRSKINLNVVRETHAEVYASSTSRPFELAAMKSCIVSAPYQGIEKWFDVGKEILVGNSSKECIEIYQTLLDDSELRNKMGEAAYSRVKKEHTARHRAKQVIEIIKKQSSS